MLSRTITSFATLFLAILLHGNLLSQTSAMPGYISGDNVNMRADHSTQAKSIALLKKNQRIFIISSYRPESNDNEAILRVSTDFYDETYGLKLFTLPKGKAVMVNRLDGNQYYISFKNDKTGRVGYAKIDTHRLEFINGETWYYVDVDNKKGWVFGKYVSYY